MRAVDFNPKAAPQRLAGEFRCSDEFRQLLTDLKLPPPPETNTVAAPAAVRFGIEYSPAPEKVRPPDITSGLVVNVVAKGSKAAKLGVRPGDIVQKVNGIAVDSGEELRRATGSKQAGIDADVIRDFKPVHLEEKAAATK